MHEQEVGGEHEVGADRTCRVEDVSVGGVSAAGHDAGGVVGGGEAVVGNFPRSW